jgi:predicted phage terminase large subunit-like protein
VEKTYKLIGRAFQQEMMLEIGNEEDRLIQDSEITRFSLSKWKEERPTSTYYITTDFATTEKKNGDWSVLSVWAVGTDGNFRWVDGVMAKQNMGANVDALFELVSRYVPLGVGIETNGQQGGFIPWLQREMATRNIFFNLLSNKGMGSAPGIRAVTSKLQRFQEIIPLIKGGKIMIPHEEDIPWLQEFWQEVRLVMRNGIKSRHDDVLDTLSQLIHIVPVVPNGTAAESVKETLNDGPVWFTAPASQDHSGIASYLP